MTLEIANNFSMKNLRAKLKDFNTQAHNNIELKRANRRIYMGCAVDKLVAQSPSYGPRDTPHPGITKL